MSQSDWVKKKVLITVRTYPTPAKKSVEVSCTAGVTEDGVWVRLFPVPYRFVEYDKRFSKYQWIEVAVRKAKSDRRPESYNLDIDSLKILTDPVPTKKFWAQRAEVVMPLKAHCMCCLRRAEIADRAPTLGIFKPKEIEAFIIEPTEAEWSQNELKKLRQSTLWEHAPAQELEKIPFRFSYQFRCDDDRCKGHKLACFDWEMGESYRSWSKKYGAGWESKFRQKFEHDMIELNDTYFYVGTVHQFPHSWIIVGLWYPRLTAAA
jgi:hypothetical protein